MSAQDVDTYGLLSALAQRRSTALVLANANEVQRASADSAVYEELRAVAKTWLKKLSLKSSTSAYEPGALVPDHQVVVINTNQPGTAVALVDRASSLIGACETFTNLDMYSGEAIPTFYGVVFHAPGVKPLVLGRFMTARNALSKSKINLSFRGEQLHEVTRPLVILDRNFDFSYLDGTFYVDNVRAFLSHFVDRTALAARVSTNVKTVSDLFPIAGVASFEERCSGSLNMALKLQRIIDAGDYAAWSVDDLKACCTEFNVPIRWTDSGQMVFDGSIKHQWNILSLLDAAHVISKLGGKKFEAVEKIPI